MDCELLGLYLNQTKERHFLKLTKISIWKFDIIFKEHVQSWKKLDEWLKFND